MSEEKTEEPTEKRLRDARERGEVAKSTDLTGAIVLGVVVCIFLAMQGFLENSFHEMMNAVFIAVANSNDFSTLATAVHSVGVIALQLMILFAGCSAAAGVVAILPQVGLGFSLTPVIPNPDAINPGNGIKRMFSVKSLTDFLRTLIKAAIIGIVMWKTVEHLLVLVGSAIEHPLPALLQVAWSAILKLFLTAIFIFFIIGVVDYKFQTWMYIRQHRMSHNEVKQEYKESEGDPHVKGARKELAREIAFSPSLKQAIKQSNVVVTNPTHYAVVLRYSRKERRAPYVVAKGRDKLAIELREFAKSEGVPIVSNPKIARALFTSPLQKSIPEQYFATVAAILIWVENIGNQQENESGVM